MDFYFQWCWQSPWKSPGRVEDVVLGCSSWWSLCLKAWGLSDSKRNGICSIHTWLENQHLMFLIMMFVFFNWPWRWGRWGVCLILRHFSLSSEASVCRWLLSGYPHPPLQLKGWHIGFWKLLIFGYLNWQAMSNIGIQPRPGCELKPHRVAPEIPPAKCTVFEQGLWSSPGSPGVWR
jgi:hypothetical protein